MVRTHVFPLSYTFLNPGWRVLVCSSGSRKGTGYFHENMVGVIPLPWWHFLQHVNGCPLSCWTLFRSWRKRLHIPRPRFRKPREILLKFSCAISAAPPAHDPSKEGNIDWSCWLLLNPQCNCEHGPPTLQETDPRKNQPESPRTKVRSLSVWGRHFAWIWDFLLHIVTALHLWTPPVAAPWNLFLHLQNANLPNPRK